MAHAIEFKLNLAGETWGQEAKSFVPHFGKGLKGKSLSDVVIEIDNYYLVSTDHLGHPVMKAVVRPVVLPAI